MSLKNILAGVVIAVFAVVSLNAVAKEPVKAGIKKAADVQELKLTGKLILKEDIKGEVKATDQVKKDEEVIKVKGCETIVCKYALEMEEDGSEIALPESKAKAGEKAIDLATMVGKKVTVVAKGKCKTVEGKKHYTIKSLVSVTEVTAPAAPAAAPAEAPAAAPAAESATK